MDPDQQRIEEDLRGLVQGDVRCDDVFTQLYSTDASIYELRPLGVVRPRSVADVVAIVRYGAENHLPIHARGAGPVWLGNHLGGGSSSTSRDIFAASLPTRAGACACSPDWFWIILTVTCARAADYSGRIPRREA